MRDATLLLPFAAVIAFTLALYAWGAWVARRQGTRAFHWAKRGILVGTCLALAGVAWALQQVGAWRVSPQSGDPGRAATHLAESISRSFTLAALPVGLGNLILLASVIVLLVGTIRASRR